MGVIFDAEFRHVPGCVLAHGAFRRSRIVTTFQSEERRSGQRERRYTQKDIASARRLHGSSKFDVCVHVTDFAVDETALATIMSLGFSRSHAIRALRETGNNVERAADWVFNHPVDSSSEMEVTPSTEAAATTATGEQNETNFSEYNSVKNCTVAHVYVRVCC